MRQFVGLDHEIYSKAGEQESTIQFLSMVDKSWLGLDGATERRAG